MVIGVGIGFGLIDYVLGIVKVYIICVGEGLFLIELDDVDGECFGICGYEFGIIIGCKCCCGWFDVVLVC